MDGAASPVRRCPPAAIYDELWSRAFNGLKLRYGEVRPDLIARLTHEVTEVMTQGVGAFLLYASQLVERCRAAWDQDDLAGEWHRESALLRAWHLAG